MDLAKRSINLTNLTKEKNKFIWTPAAEKEFLDLKNELLGLPSLNLPDMSKEFILYTDSSAHALGAVLAQLDENNFPCPVAFASRKLKEVETRYSATERELLAIVWAVGYFKCYLYNNKFTIYTDHAALTNSLKISNPPSRIGRWLTAIADYKFDIKYIKGKCNTIADFLSRFVEYNVETVLEVNNHIEEITSNNVNNCNSEAFNNNINSFGNWLTSFFNCKFDNMQFKGKIVQYNRETVVEFSNFNENNVTRNVINTNSIMIDENVKCSRNSGQDIYVQEVNEDCNHVQTEIVNNCVTENVNNIVIGDSESLLVEIREAQKCDKFCFKIIERLVKNLKTGTKNVRYLVKNDILMCNFRKPRARRDYGTKIVLPRCLVPKIFELAHSSPSACHHGSFKTLTKIQSDYFWSGMYADVKRLIKSCQACLEFRAHRPRVLAEMQKLQVADSPSQILHVDIAGPYPQTFQGNKYIVAYVDSFSKWPEAFAVSNITSDTIAETLTKVICRLGCPKVIVSDRGTNLLSKAIETVYAKLGVKHITTTAYRPCSNGKIERQHATLNAALAQLVNSSHNNWDEMLDFALLAVRSSVHSSINETPFFVNHGRDIRLPFNMLAIEHPVNYNDAPSYCENLISNMSNVFKNVKAKLESVAEKQVIARSKISKNKNIKINDLVMLFVPVVKPGLCKKFMKCNYGPYRVIKRTSAVNFVIQSVKEPTKTQNVHVDRITKILEKPLFPAWPEQVDLEQNSDTNNNDTLNQNSEQQSSPPMVLSSRTRRRRNLLFPPFIPPFPLVDGNKCKETENLSKNDNSHIDVSRNSNNFEAGESINLINEYNKENETSLIAKIPCDKENSMVQNFENCEISVVREQVQSNTGPVHLISQSQTVVTPVNKIVNNDVDILSETSRELSIQGGGNGNKFVGSSGTSSDSSMSVGSQDAENSKKLKAKKGGKDQGLSGPVHHYGLRPRQAAKQKNIEVVYL